jgi:hypothetical protein
MERSRLFTGIIATLIASLFGGAACTPVFQDARLVGPGRVQITPSISGAGVSRGGDSEYLVTTFAAQAEIGATERFSIGGGYAYFRDRSGDGLNTAVFGPKFGVVRDRVAIGVPTSVAFGENVQTSDTWQFHPMALFTVPLGERVDFNPSARLLIPVCDGCETLAGFNAGFGLHTASRLTVRPEFGILINPGEGGVIWTFGVGVSLGAGR